MSDFDEISSEPRWYVAHTYSGYENKVKTNLEKIIENRGLQDVIMDVRVPVEIVKEESGKDENGNPIEKEIENKIFPELCACQNEDERRDMAYCPQYTRRYRICRSRIQARSALRCGGRLNRR